MKQNKQKNSGMAKSPLKHNTEAEKPSHSSDWKEELIRDTMQVIDTRAKIGKGTDDLEDVYKALENLISKIQTILEKDFDEKIKAIFDELDNFFATFVDERLNVIGDLRDYEQYKDIKKWVDGK